MCSVQSTSLHLPKCEVAEYNVGVLSPEEFTAVRRNGIGASDTSVILGLMTKFNKTSDDVILDKLQRCYTEQEAAISDKPAVRMGRELEPLVLEKAAKILNTNLVKPQDMYRLLEYPWLTVNFDGIIESGLIPVEAKCITKFGEKNYQFDVIDGIPDYYKAQLQHQMLASGSDYGYLAGFRIDKWELVLFKIKRDEKMIRDIVTESYKVWQKVERGRNAR